MLEFDSIGSFSPEALIERIDYLRDLRDARAKLRDLRGKARDSKELAQLLEQLVKDPDRLKQMMHKLESEAAPTVEKLIVGDAKQTKTETKTIGEFGLLDQVLEVTKLTTEEDRIKDLLSVFGTQVRANKFIDRGLLKSFDQVISEYDCEISRLLAAVIHHPKFKALEGSWRGLHGLIKNSNLSPTLQVKVLDADKEALIADFEASEQGGLARHALPAGA